MKKVLTGSLVCCYLFYGCIKMNSEQPFDVAKNYCNCLNITVATHKDSAIDLEDCEKATFEKSRFMQLNALDTRDPLLARKTYSDATLDSANIFFSEVIRIIDTMCIQKTDTKKIKKKAHAF